ncbi:MAG: hypothetical protein JHD35_03165 [Sphingopyxis sp.]|nr:hypothetical protein [Sphingopyxis sp.]
MLMGIVCTAITTMLVLVLLGGAVHKIVSVSRLASAAAKLAGVPLELGGIPSFSSFLCEIAAATAILYPPTRHFGFAAAAALWGTYAALSWRANRRGEKFDCGCCFTLAAPRGGRWPIWRSAILALCAAGAALLSGDPVFELPPLLAGIGFLGLLFAADGIAAVPLAAGRLPE